MKICTECKYGMREIRGPVAYIPARCAHPSLKSPIDGRPLACHINRSPVGGCGLEARLFEPKPPKPARKWWEFWR